MENKTIHPSEKMPEPNHYFYLVVQIDDHTRYLIPAVLTQYCGSRDFYMNCVALNKNGSIINNMEDWNWVGWEYMFNIPAYKIQTTV